MATITIDTTPEQDAAAKRMTDRYNAGSVNPPLTVLQYAKREILALINFWVSSLADEDRISKASAYRLASDADKAAVDSILAKYQ